MVDNDQTNCVKQENSTKREQGGKQIDVKRHRGNTIHFGNSSCNFFHEATSVRGLVV